MPENSKQVFALDDKKILYLYKEEGKREFAFNLIVQKYSERLYWHIRSLTLDHQDTNDLLQTTLIKIWSNLPNFREESKLYTWIYRIATNETLTFLKRKQLTSFLSLSSYDAVLENKLASDSYFNGDKMQKALQKAILKLPPTQRVVFNFRYFQEMPYEEISQIMNTSVGSLKASYHHAYKKIKKEMEDLFLD
ncbi:MAG: sigma-70 family RNA polymerase sigma factor [Bacteroidales bacterium]|nr:sigma-70 family RNA polymerase sigma factor [Bacteroidales bacterium]MBQ1929577.1 sigma-70 family RNA polymerase sigma factor [Bacteroidales bacterium]MBR6540263.1 sigma-70 family RNA polymerase sigma factor [Bacteroidales bacterium]